MDEFFDHFLSSASWSDLNAKESSYWGLCESGQLDDSPISTINSNQCLESLAAQETPTVLINGESDHDHDLLQGVLSTRSRKNDQGLVDLGHPQKQLEDLADMSRSSLEFPKLSGFDLQGRYVNNDTEFVSNGYDVLLDEALQFDDLSASVARKGELDLYNNFRPSVTSAGLNCLSQATPGSISNGTAKPRPRARRGQATDPHSIAERLRREKIAERMRSLQELVPNSNKTDKASMLDEILDYVKFLQLQVKVLSTSRLGTSGEGVPLNKNSQTEVSHPLVGDSQSPDEEALEQETVKLMESSMTMTMAMRYLQSKGLCLMPTSLAASISDAKTSSSSSIVSDGNSCSNKGVKQEVSKELKPEKHNLSS